MVNHHGSVAGLPRKYLDDETLPEDEERQLLGALVAISSGVEDVAKLNVPVEVGRRLLQCYDDLRKP